MKRLYALLLLPLTVACAGVEASAPNRSTEERDDAPRPSDASDAPASDDDIVVPPSSLAEVEIAPDFDFRATHAVRLSLTTQEATPLIVRLGGRVVYRGRVPAGGQLLSWASPRYVDEMQLEWRRGAHTFERRVALPASTAQAITLEEVL